MMPGYILLPLFANRATVPYFCRLCLGGGTAEQQSSQSLFVERKKRPKIAEATEGGSGCNRHQNQNQADYKARKPPKACCDCQNNTVHSQRITNSMLEMESEANSATAP